MKSFWKKKENTISFIMVDHLKSVCQCQNPTLAHAFFFHIHLSLLQIHAYCYVLHILFIIIFSGKTKDIFDFINLHIQNHCQFTDRKW